MPSPIPHQALGLAAAGQVAQAIALLQRGCAQGDVDALFTLATWHLAGHGVARDLAQARALLRRAVQIGHVDAALMEAALTANGSGGTADWPGARALLAEAARGDPLARDHLTLLDAMALDEQGMPRRPAVSNALTNAWPVIHFPAFLTAAECHHLIAEGEPMLEPAMIVDPATGARRPHPIRASDNAAFGPARETLVVQAINRRIAQASATQVAQGEPLTLLRYRERQEYRLHHDCLPEAGNQRVWTMILYLNEGYLGGETLFPRLGLSVRAHKGDALLFRNVLDDGRPADLAMHQGKPVERGQKWICTRWIRAGDHDPWTAGG